MGCEILGAMARQDASEPGPTRRATLVHDDRREDREVDGPWPHIIDGQSIMARSGGGGSAGGWFLCPEHLRASRRSRRTRMRALFWQAMIEKCFSEPTLYRIVSSGQYLKLCTLAEDVARQVDESWRQVILEADATAGKSAATRDRRARQRRPGKSERRCRR